MKRGTLKLLLIFIYFFTQILFSPVWVQTAFASPRTVYTSSPKSIWSERVRRNTPKNPVFPSLIQKRKSRVPEIDNYIRGLSPNLHLKEVYSGQSGRPLVLLIQDIHQNYVAQKNIGKALQFLISKNDFLVGVEGAFGPFDFSPYRQFPELNVTREIADYLLRENFIAATSWAGLTSEKTAPLIVGVEDRSLYFKNLESFKKSFPLKIQALRTIDDQWSEINGKRYQILSIPLNNLFDAVMAYHNGDVPLVDLIRNLTLWVPVDSFPSLKTFLNATRMEKNLDIEKARLEKTKLFEKFSDKEPHTLETLLKLSLSHQTGEVNSFEYFKALNQLFESLKVDLAEYPHFNSYLQYLQLANQIRPEVVFKEIRKMRDRAVNVLAESEIQKEFLARAIQLQLKERLVHFELTPEEWSEYHPGLEPSLDPFEAFYKNARVRDQMMVRKLLEEMARYDQKRAVLISGGFHTPGISSLLKQQGISFAILTPKVTKISEQRGSDYLNVFLRERSPLAKRFFGEKLTIANAAQNLGNTKATEAVLRLGLLQAFAVSIYGYGKGAVNQSLHGLGQLKSLIPGKQAVVSTANGNYTIGIDVKAEKPEHHFWNVFDLKRLAWRFQKKPKKVGAYLTAEWVFMGTIISSYHIMFFTGVMVFAEFHGTSGLMGFLKNEVVGSLIATVLARHILIAPHEMGHYYAADKRDDLQSVTMRKSHLLRPKTERALRDAIGENKFDQFGAAEFFENGKLKEMDEKEMRAYVNILDDTGFKPSFLKRLLFGLKIFLLIPYGFFKPIQITPGVLGKFFPEFKILDKSKLLDTKARGPLVDILLYTPSLVLGIFLFWAYFDPFYRSILVLSFITNWGGRLLITLGFVGLLQGIRQDDAALFKWITKIFKEHVTISKKKYRKLEWDSKAIKKRMIETRMQVVENFGKILRAVWEFRNVAHGGAHTKDQPGANISFQEFMIVPKSAKNMVQAQNMSFDIQTKFKELVSSQKEGMKYYGTGKEGGVVGSFAVKEDNVDGVPETHLLDILMEAIDKAGYVAGVDVMIAIDAAASELNKGQDMGVYKFWRYSGNVVKSTEEMIEMYKRWVEKYPIISIEDGLAEKDYDGWLRLKQELGDKVFIIGDDLSTTNEDILLKVVTRDSKGKPIRIIDLQDTTLIKYNQIGTLSETLRAIVTVKNEKKQTAISHRSGSTEDPTEADVALGTDSMVGKWGGAVGMERLLKYARAARILLRHILGKPPGKADPKTRIASIFAEVADTNAGDKTVRVTVTLTNGAVFMGSAPVGASAGSNEAVHLTDSMIPPNHDMRLKYEDKYFEMNPDSLEFFKENPNLPPPYRFYPHLARKDIERENDNDLLALYDRAQGPDSHHGKNNQNAVDNVNNIIAPLFEGKTLDQLGDLGDIDQTLLALEREHSFKLGFLNPSADEDVQRTALQRKSALGMNAILSVSIAMAHVLAVREGVELWELIRKEENKIKNNYDSHKQTLYSGEVPQIIPPDIPPEKEFDDWLNQMVHGRPTQDLKLGIAQIGAEVDRALDEYLREGHENLVKQNWRSAYAAAREARVLIEENPFKYRSFSYDRLRYLYLSSYYLVKTKPRINPQLFKTASNVNGSDQVQRHLCDINRLLWGGDDVLNTADQWLEQMDLWNEGIGLSERRVSDESLKEKIQKYLIEKIDIEVGAEQKHILRFEEDPVSYIYESVYQIFQWDKGRTSMPYEFPSFGTAAQVINYLLARYGGHLDLEIYEFEYKKLNARSVVSLSSISDDSVGLKQPSVETKPIYGSYNGNVPEKKNQQKRRDDPNSSQDLFDLGNIILLGLGISFFWDLGLPIEAEIVLRAGALIGFSLWSFQYIWSQFQFRSQISKEKLPIPYIQSSQAAVEVGLLTEKEQRNLLKWMGNAQLKHGNLVNWKPPRPSWTANHPITHRNSLETDLFGEAIQKQIATLSNKGEAANSEVDVVLLADLVDQFTRLRNSPSRSQNISKPFSSYAFKAGTDSFYLKPGKREWRYSQMMTWALNLGTRWAAPITNHDPQVTRIYGNVVIFEPQDNRETYKKLTIFEKVLEQAERNPKPNAALIVLPYADRELKDGIERRLEQTRVPYHLVDANSLSLDKLFDLKYLTQISEVSKMSVFSRMVGSGWTEGYLRVSAFNTSLILERNRDVRNLNLLVLLGDDLLQIGRRGIEVMLRAFDLAREMA